MTGVSPARERPGSTVLCDGLPASTPPPRPKRVRVQPASPPQSVSAAVGSKRQRRVWAAACGATGLALIAACVVLLLAALEGQGATRAAAAALGVAALAAVGTALGLLLAGGCRSAARVPPTPAVRAQWVAAVARQLPEIEPPFGVLRRVLHTKADVEVARDGTLQAIGVIVTARAAARLELRGVSVGAVWQALLQRGTEGLGPPMYCTRDDRGGEEGRGQSLLDPLPAADMLAAGAAEACALLKIKLEDDNDLALATGVLGQCLLLFATLDAIAAGGGDPAAVLAAARARA